MQTVPSLWPTVKGHCALDCNRPLEPLTLPYDRRIHRTTPAIRSPEQLYGIYFERWGFEFQWLSL